METNHLSPGRKVLFTGSLWLEEAHSHELRLTHMTTMWLSRARAANQTYQETSQQKEVIKEHPGLIPKALTWKERHGWLGL